MIDLHPTLRALCVCLTILGLAATGTAAAQTGSSGPSGQRGDDTRDVPAIDGSDTGSAASAAPDTDYGAPENNEPDDVSDRANDQADVSAPAPTMASETLGDGDPEAAANDDSAAIDRPVYLQILPVDEARYAMLSEELVASLAREALSNARQPAIRMGAEDLPPNVRVLRVMYVEQRQDMPESVVATAAASITLLRTVGNDGDGLLRTESISQSLQQTLIQDTTVTEARQQLREAFKRELQVRIAELFSDSD